MRRRFALLSAPTAAATLLALFAVAGPAAAKSRCVPAEGATRPVVTFPCQNATLARNHNITFRVRDTYSHSRTLPPELVLSTRKPPKSGHLGDTPAPNGFYAILKSVRRSAVNWSYTPEKFDFPGWWLATRGTYYVQVQQDSTTGGASTFYGPISRIHVR